MTTEEISRRAECATVTARKWAKDNDVSYEAAGLKSTSGRKRIFSVSFYAQSRVSGRGKVRTSHGYPPKENKNAFGGFFVSTNY